MEGLSKPVQQQSMGREVISKRIIITYIQKITLLETFFISTLYKNLITCRLPYSII